jgi:O-antigen/teichoic acid export membrane protein
MLTYIKISILSFWRTHYSPSLNIVVWLTIRAGFQALITVMTAKTLGAYDYGNFIAFIAVASFLSPLAGLGLHGTLLINGARNPECIPLLLGNSLAIWWRSTCITTIIGISVAYIALPTPPSLLATGLLICAEIWCSSFIELAARAEQSQRNSNRFGALLAGLPAIRLIGLIVLVITSSAMLNNWIYTYSISSIGYSMLVFLWLISRRPSIHSNGIDLKLISKGFPFCVGALTMRLQNELNKPILAQNSYVETGNFSIAQRIIDLASLPLAALQENFWPRFYATPKTTTNSFIQTLIASVGILFFGGLIGIAITTIAPLIPLLLGAGFNDAATAVMWLAWLPLVQAARNLINATFIANDKQRLLTAIYIVGAALGVSFNLWLIPRLGIQGAIAAAYLSEIATLLMLSFFLSFRQKITPQ